jgi:hypothetical protein
MRKRALYACGRLSRKMQQRERQETRDEERIEERKKERKKERETISLTPGHRKYVSQSGWTVRKKTVR